MPYFSDDLGTRIAKDSGGKTIEVPSSMNYKQWYSIFVENT